MLKVLLLIMHAVEAQSLSWGNLNPNCYTKITAGDSDPKGRAIFGGITSDGKLIKGNEWDATKDPECYD